MFLFLFLASIASGLHFSVVLKDENALVVPYYSPAAEKVEYSFEIHSDSDVEWGLEFGQTGQCQYNVDLLTMEEDGSKVIHGNFEATEEGQYYFRICPSNYSTDHPIYGDIHVRSTSNGYANAFDYNLVDYNVLISIFYIVVIAVWGFILSTRTSVRSHHHMLTALVILTGATHCMTVLQLWQYDEYGYATSDAWTVMVLVLQSVRNLLLVMYGMQTCSGWGMLYSEWCPLTYYQIAILIGFFASDFGTSMALELFLPNENTNLYLGVLIFRHIFVLTAVCVYTTIKMDESSTSQEKINSQATIFYSKVSTLIVFILSTSCTILMSGLLYAKYDGNMYNFWAFQYGWIDLSMFVFLCGLLYLYKPTSELGVFYKGMDADSTSDMSVSLMFAGDSEDFGIKQPLV